MFLLEPISCLLRLSMLAYLPVGTKVGIDSNRIYLITPSTLQPIMRWYNGCSRDDLFFLQRPIVCARTLIDRDITDLLQHAARGVITLKRTYDVHVNTTSQALKLYYSYLLGADIDRSDIQEEDDFSMQVYHEYRKIWSDAQIKIACGILNEASKCAENNTPHDGWICALDSILNTMENAALDILTNLTRGITKNKDTK